jgi:hypothetical protein
MGDTSGAGGAIGGAGGGKSGGGAPDQTGGGGDPTGGLGLGLGGDPTGMGGMNPAMGFADTFATLSDPGAAGVQQQMAARGFGSAGQQPLTDQPGAQAQQPPQQTAQQPPQQQGMTAEQMAHAIFNGPAGPSGTPGDASFGERFGATENPAGFAERFGASDPSNIYNNTASPGGATTTGAAPAPTPTQAYPSGGLPKLPPTAAPMDRGDEFPNIDPSQNPSLLRPGTTYNPATDPSLSGATPPATTANVPLPPSRPNTGQDLPATATPQVTPPGTPAPAGTMPQSPLEQLVSGFMHMLFGGGQGGLGPLEQLIGSMLGVNPHMMFPGFYDGGFNRPPGPGYFPPGTVGGRQIGASPAGPPGPRSPQVPARPMPGAPPAPQGPQRQASLPTPDPRKWLPTGSTERLPGPSPGDAANFIQSRGGRPAGAGAPDLNPDFASRLAAAGQAYEQETGQKAQFGETGRSREKQAEYYNEMKRTGQGLAAPPGQSRHQRGLAADIPHGPFQDWMHKNAARFGIEGLRDPRDPYHFQMSGNARPTAQASEPRLPGPPYTATRSNLRPPWYQPERNPATRRPTASATPPASGSAPIQGGTSADYVSQNSIAASRIAGSDTRPTPGYSTTMRDARARAFQGMDDQTKRLVAGMASAELSNDPIGPIEALLNRSAQTGTPVRTLLYNGFYRNTAPTFASRAAQLQSSGQIGRYMAAIEAVQNGSNVLAGATDQGSAKLNDPNAQNPSGRIIRYDESFNDHTPASARWRQQIQRRVQQELQAVQ